MILGCEIGLGAGAKKGEARKKDKKNVPAEALHLHDVPIL